MAISLARRSMGHTYWALRSGALTYWLSMWRLRFWIQAGRIWCGFWQGHGWQLERGRDALALICSECGTRTPGLQVESTSIRWQWHQDRKAIWNQRFRWISQRRTLRAVK